MENRVLSPLPHLSHFIQSSHMTKGQFLKIAKPLMSLPTAAYHEHHVMQHIETLTTPWNHLSIRKDSFGNRLLFYKGTPKKPTTGDLILQAHVDHPGMIWEKNLDNGVALFRQAGGYSQERIRNARLNIHSIHEASHAKPISGTLKRIIQKKKQEDARYEVQLDTPSHINRLQAGTFAVWKLSAFRMRGSKVHARACDDLAGVATALAVLNEVQRKNLPIRLGVLITRAEEVGFGGLLASIQKGFLSKKDFYINIECSSIRAGAVQGKGPVIRVGDATWIFDPDITGGLVTLAKQLNTRRKTFPYQRKLMDSGSCEATVLKQNGFRVGAVTLPLGNYHNMGDEGGLKEETIDLNDALGLTQLLLTLATSNQTSNQAIKDASKSLSERLATRRQKSIPLLKQFPID